MNGMCVFYTGIWRLCEICLEINGYSIYGSYAKKLQFNCNWLVIKYVCTKKWWRTMIILSLIYWLLALLKICSLYKFCRVTSCTCWAGDLCSLSVEVQVKCGRWFTSIYTTSVNCYKCHRFYWLSQFTRSIMGCSLRVTRAGVAGNNCEC